MLAQLIRTHPKDTLVAFVQPIEQATQIWLRVDPVQSLVAIVDEGDFGGPDDFAAFIDPNSGWHVYHAIQRGYGVLFVDQNGVFGTGFLNPRTGVLDASDIFGDGYDFEILILVFSVEFLPARQIETAASPGSPSDQQNTLAAELMQRARNALPIRQRKIGSFQRVRNLHQRSGA